MSVDAIIGTSGIGLVALLSLIQIAPIKINPWSALARAFGRAINLDVTDKLNELQSSVDNLESRVTEFEYKTGARDMDLCRARIIRFADEIRRHIDHSEEFFDHILSDITVYESYCKDHPTYKNEKAVRSIEKIRQTYDYCVNENKFL